MMSCVVGLFMVWARKRKAMMVGVRLWRGGRMVCV